MQVLGIVFFLKQSTKTIKNILCEHLCWRFAMITPLNLWPHQEMQQKMPAIPRSFVASRAGSYPSALRSWLCRVTLRPRELIHRKSGDICAMVGCVWNRNNLSIFFWYIPGGGWSLDFWITSSPKVTKTFTRKLRTISPRRIHPPCQVCWSRSSLCFNSGLKATKDVSKKTHPGWVCKKGTEKSPLLVSHKMGHQL